ncbi:MAG: acyltransferase family protein [Verrucomicrobiales bacterium]|nr:acyltransferase family protein [Verrucomicrobiales bacterium]
MLPSSTAPAPGSNGGAPRYHALDSLRAVAMLLGILYHALLFGGGMGSMFGGTPGPDARLMEWIHSFRMPMFFMISGFFCHMMLTKYGVGRYLSRRWWRLGAAVLIYLTVIAGIAWLRGGQNDPFSPRGGGPPVGPGPRGTAEGLEARQRPPFPGAPGGAPQGTGFNPGGPMPDRRGPDAPGGPPPGGGFGPGMILAGVLTDAADGNHDQKIAREEMVTVAGAWFRKFDAKGSGTLGAEGFATGFAGVIPGPPGTEGPGGGPPGGPGAFLGRMFGPVYFAALDGNHDGSLTSTEMTEGFLRWFSDGGGSQESGITQDQLRDVLNRSLKMPGGPGGGMGFGQSSPMAERLFGSWARQFNLGPMWFIWYLLVFATAAPLLAWGWRWIAHRIAPQSRGPAPGSVWRLLLVPVLLALVTLPARMATTSYGGWSLGGAMGIFQPIPDVLFRFQADWPFYFAYFLTGWWLFSAREQMSRLAHLWIPFLTVGFATYFAAVRFSETFSSMTGLPTYPWLRITGHGLFAVSGAFLSFGFLGFFQRFFDRPTRTGRYLADTAFWLYLVHQELLIQVILPRLRPYSLPWWIQSTVAILLVGVVGCLTFELLVRRTPLTHLFGPPPPGRRKVPKGATGEVQAVPSDRSVA